MSCPTCGHTMAMIFQTRERTLHHCERCGTMRSDLLGNVSYTVPKLVERCRIFAETLGPAWGDLWQRLGIKESITPPEERAHE